MMKFLKKDSAGSALVLGKTEEGHQLSWLVVVLLISNLDMARGCSEQRVLECLQLECEVPVVEGMS